MTLSRRDLLVLGSAAASLTLIGNKEVLALIPSADRYHLSISMMQDLVDRYRREAGAPAMRYTMEERPYGDLSWDGTHYVRKTRVERVLTPEFYAWSHGPARAAWLRSGRLDLWSKQADQVILDLMKLFPENPDPENMAALFDGKLVVDAFDDASLRTIMPGLVPIALIRGAIQREHLPFHMGKMRSMMAFVERYRMFLPTSANRSAS